MARKKTITKAKEPVTIRFKKLANGNQSIYLDFYKGNGQREYRFLKLYLIPETTNEAKIANKNTLQAAIAIKSQAVDAITKGKAGIKTNQAGGKMQLLDWLDVYSTDRAAHHKRIGAIVPNLKKILTAYRGDATTLNDVDKNYCKGLIQFMGNGYTTQYGKPLSPFTAQGCLSMFSTILNAAVRADLIAVNPFDKLAPGDKITAKGTTRQYLLADEIKALIATPMPTGNKAQYTYKDGRVYGGRDIKAAFLFSCFSGLRLSDVKNLTWSRIVDDAQSPSGLKIDGMISKKTTKALYNPITKAAAAWLPDRCNIGREQVYNLPNSDGYTDKQIAAWAKAAGIDKKVTFHVARHTFATLALTAEIPIEVVSDLLNHSDIATTQIYAEIIGKQKVVAANKFDNLIM